MMRMVSMQKIERILDSMAGVNYLEWRMIAEKIEQQFERRKNRTELQLEDAEQICAGIKVECGARIPMEDAR